MTPRVKKLLGIFILTPTLFVYVFAAAALGERLPSHWALQLAFYAAAGVAWAFPMKYLMRWMNAPAKSNTK